MRRWFNVLSDPHAQGMIVGVSYFCKGSKDLVINAFKLKDLAFKS